MMFTAPDVSSLAGSLVRWEVGEYISEAFVIVACAGELVADLGRKCLTRAHRDRVERLSTISLVVALLASLICLVRTNELSGRVVGSLRDNAVEAAKEAEEALSDSATALKQSEEAKGKANTAEDAAGRARTKADTASAKADEVDRSLGMTQFLISARHVEDIDSLTEQLRQFKGHPVTLISYAGDKEGTGLCSALVSITRSAQMIPADLCGAMSASGNLLTEIAVSGPDVEQTVIIGGIISRTGRLGVSSGMKAPNLTIFVGVKSPFVIGQARSVKAPAEKK